MPKCNSNVQFRPETIVASFLHSMLLLPKVLFNHRKCSSASLACIFSKSFTKSKCLGNGCEATISSPSMLVTTVHELWHLIEVAWAAILVHAILSAYNSIPRRITAVLAAEDGWSKHRFLRLYHSKFLGNLTNCYL